MAKNISRRDFLRGGLAAAAGVALGATTISVPAFAEDKSLPFEQRMDWDAEYDVIVMGYGLAGAVASVRAADEGAKVLLIEKAPQGEEGGNSRYAGQSMLTVEGGAVNRDAALAYLKRVRGKYNTPDDATLEAFIDTSLTSADWFKAHGGNPVEKYHKIGEFQDIEGWDLMSCWSQNGGIHDAGTYLAMQRIVNDTPNLDVWYDAPATDLIQDPETKIIHGVRVNVQGKSYAVRALNGVVMTVGGFENNIQMIQDYHQLPEAYSKGALFNTGDGVKMGIAVGANLWHMRNTAGPDLNAVDPGAKRSYGYAIIGPHALLSTNFSQYSVILVGADGTRFTSESVMPGHGYVNFHGRKIQQPVSLPAYLVFDSAAFAQTIYKNWNNEEKVADGTIKKADTLAELTGILGLPEGSLEATVKQYNSFCASGNDVEFHRNPETLNALSESGPYYAFEVKPTYTNTQGGPERSAAGEVLDTKGKPIPHLYSAGECGSIWGDIYQGAGNLGECFAYGIISGKNAAAEKSDNFRGSVMEGKTSVSFAAVKAEIDVSKDEYIGVGTGIGGDIKLGVKVEDGKIVDVSVLEQHETPEIGGRAFDTLVEQAKAAGSIEIDGVSGATVTTNGFKTALEDALSHVVG